MSDQDNQELDTKHVPVDEVESAPVKRDRRSVTSAINFEKARKAKLAQLKHKREMQEYEIKSDDDDEYEYEEGEEPAYVMKKRRPVRKEEKTDALSMILNRLEEMTVKKKPKPKPKPKQRASTNIVINPPPASAPIPIPTPSPAPKQLDPMEMMRVNQLKDGLLK